jgi:hypothetical protein
MFKFIGALALGIVIGLYLATNPFFREIGAYLAAMSLSTLL